MLFNETAKSYEEYNNKINNFVKDETLKDLLKKLIVEDVHKRINWEDFFNHDFFDVHEIDYDKIENIVIIKN